MNMKKLIDELNKKNIEAKYVNVDTEKTKQERVYLNDLDERFDFYFSEFEGKLFLNVWIKRDRNFDYKMKISDEQKQKEIILRKKAKLKVLENLKKLGVENLEEFSEGAEVNLSPKKVKRDKPFTLDLGD